MPEPPSARTANPTRRFEERVERTAQRRVNADAEGDTRARAASAPGVHAANAVDMRTTASDDVSAKGARGVVCKYPQQRVVPSQKAGHGGDVSSWNPSKLIGDALARNVNKVRSVHHKQIRQVEHF